jgi:hypothetical protein
LDEGQLAHIVETVRGQDGFVRGYWGQASDDPRVAHAFVVFDTLEAASRMADGIRSAISSASLEVITLLADAAV